MAGYRPTSPVVGQTIIRESKEIVKRIPLFLKLSGLLRLQRFLSKVFQIRGIGLSSGALGATIAEEPGHLDR